MAPTIVNGQLVAPKPSAFQKVWSWTLNMYNGSGPYVRWGADALWFAGSSALLLALPVLLELNRETTVLVMQKMREQEMVQAQEQARQIAQSASVMGALGEAIKAGAEMVRPAGAQKTATPNESS